MLIKAVCNPNCVADITTSEVGTTDEVHQGMCAAYEVASNERLIDNVEYRLERYR